MNKKLNLIIVLLLIIPTVYAIPETLNMQGKLTKTDGTVETGTHNFTFRLYDDKTAGNLLWEETQSIALSNGVYDAILGEVNDISNISFGPQYYITTKIGSDSEMLPRINLTSVPYAFVAKNAENLTCGSCIIGGNNLSSTYVGIGTTSPEVTLTVDSGRINTTAIISQDINENLNTSSAFQIRNEDGGNSDKILHFGVYGGNTKGTRLGLAAANLHFIRADGPLAIGTGDSTAETFVLSVNDVPRMILNGVDSSARFYGGDVNISEGGKEGFFFDTTNERLGIGVAAPSVNLDVNGLSHFSGNVTFADNLTVDGNTFYVDASSDRIGIGTSSPGSQLEIMGATGDLFNISNGTDDHLVIDNLGNMDTGKGNFRIGGPPPSSKGEGKLHINLDFLTGANPDTDDALNGNFDTMAISLRGGGDDDGSDAIGIGFALNALATYPSAQINYIETMNWGRGALAFYTKIATDYNTAPIERMRIDANGNVTVWGALHAATRTGGAIDIAELIYSEGTLPQPGDVLIASSNQTVSLSQEPYDTKVVGIVSTKPHLSMGAEYGSENSVELALTGRVPVKVTLENGNIEVGDLLTTSSTSGKAMKCEVKDLTNGLTYEQAYPLMQENERCRNSVIGKALENFDEKTKHEAIMTLVTLQ